MDERQRPPDDIGKQHVETVDPSALRRLKLRAHALPACAAAAFALGFFVPGRNMLAMLPTLFLPAPRPA